MSIPLSTLLFIANIPAFMPHTAKVCINHTYNARRVCSPPCSCCHSFPAFDLPVLRVSHGIQDWLTDGGSQESRVKTHDSGLTTHDSRLRQEDRLKDRQKTRNTSKDRNSGELSGRSGGNTRGAHVGPCWPMLVGLWSVSCCFSPCSS